MMTKHELIEKAYEFTGGNIADLTIDQLRRLITVTQYVTDICLNELERRDELPILEGVPVLPYESDYVVETILTRPELDLYRQASKRAQEHRGTKFSDEKNAERVGSGGKRKASRKKYHSARVAGYYD